MYATWYSYLAITENGSKFSNLRFTIQTGDAWGVRYPWLSTPLNLVRAYALNTDGSQTYGNFIANYGARQALY